MSLGTPGTPFARWICFNLVGAAGMAVQLGVLALLNRAFHGHYLLTATAALEVTLLHNFVWHVRLTWRDRRGTLPVTRQLWRFHLSNGLLSLAGNLVLLRLLVHTAHLPVVPANAIGIACCSLANFGLSHGWTFPAAPAPKPGE